MKRESYDREVLLFWKFHNFITGMYAGMALVHVLKQVLPL